ncbi:hypothetical protein Z945_146 [Sulfitobacter noctilucae]|uniref:hypothetical protein n=1 Tax=Sulfitobacter noctilucae TaxID=1342302 RepID=UPI0013776F6B|nr:hypothetical protein [Sulfitobacter noctilucae]KIN75317.1 hypothetical protein Z945_146 [Sulfitobacter noctilucae]
MQRAMQPVFKAAESWEALTVQLQQLGYTLRPMGSGLALYTAQGRTHVCNTATVGYRYRALVKKFGCPMPGHPHGATWIKTADKPSEPQEIYEVIERERPFDPTP